MTPKNILLAITGGISAYKSAILARLLIKSGHQVRVMMTPSACEFITPLTFQALTGNEVHTELLDAQAEKGMGHIELAKWADLVVIAPASANTIGKLANGLADNLVTNVILATTAPVMLAPAMNQAMWGNAIVQDNLAKLARFGFTIIAPDSGEQACGDVGAGRLPEPESLCEQIDQFLTIQNTAQTLAGKTVVITAGATLEPIDPVRYLSNHSTGKMGYALAKACVNARATVIIVAGAKVNLPTPLGVKKITIGTADEMLQACLQVCEKADIFIATAAVADFKVANIATQKLKKTADNDGLTLHLVKNPDVLATISTTYPHLLTVGFAAETNDVENYAKGKLIAKNLDMIAVNDVSDKTIGFGSDDNAMTVFFAEKYGLDKVNLAKMSKDNIAKGLVGCIGELLGG
ncbi:bifunctional phosphopantothenoylcysteine decarboxylase/phosphopantothenate--cysteine ligase CoaBC [Moraxella bovis]|uniref:bifunctional phosphopantothenoylcysteine decarboxylase/phosphopantothenate--cysteine ligase CoaBC n=1 Tax=Moraxella bovis TaxID=476 RepID=UPI0022272549|nr:bifunctional phosphopantothenoylcysteine decarboxylase/phosphopantothenate--cysteine ligase CoaBC [Moraxella bovis]UYZ68794.1 bifunctional phosphopantothenoylcysteine decarboxylase/phosphopantothenate--cysteine ligase CoaBC [Moraxella bovis]UYZ89189.1 bifunctional phosphopantothenoylcysteine decarboxylase/phosphopantothenate--cysteine ligase CoaBC [Moraxella bovis]UZA14466.1 bifunctional phosphopantothenoylcysteine decarboxylase/phosphopantothenate--cysteine ligase CoaBC [Moraxella bovis]UZA